MTVDKLDAYGMAVQAFRIAEKEISLADPSRQVAIFSGKDSKIVEMYVGLMILEHIIAYLAKRTDD